MVPGTKRKFACLAMGILYRMVTAMKKFWKSVFLPVLLAAALTACSAQADSLSFQPASSVPAADPEPSPHSASLPESSTPAPEAEASGEIQRTLSCGAAVNAVVSCPGSVDFSSLSSYSGALHSFDPEAVKNVLLGEGEIPCQKDETAAGSLIPGAVYHFFTGEDGQSLMVQGETVTYDKDGLYSSVAPWFHLDKADGLYNGELFPADKDLPFASRQQGYEELRQVLGKLGVEVSSQYDCYAVEESALQKAEQRLEETSPAEMPEEGGAAGRDALEAVSSEAEAGEAALAEVPADEDAGAVPSEAEGAPVKELPAERNADPESRECYFYRLYTDIQGVPVTAHENGSVDKGTYLPGATIEALYAADGLHSLHISCVFDAGENQTPAQALDLEGALNKLDELYQQGVLEDTVEVREIALEYVPVADASRVEVELAPAWRFGVLRTRAYPEKSNPQETVLVPDYEQVMIHALTGKEILLDQGSIL